MKKKLKLKKNIKIILVCFVFGIIAGIFAVKKYQEYKYHQTNEYKLINVGYSQEEAKNLLEKVNEEDIQRLINGEKQEYILSIIQEKYFIAKNFERYLAYYEKNEETSIPEIIAIVNVNRDYELYTHDINTDTTKEEQMLVNKYYKLSKDYIPDDIVDMANMYRFSNPVQIREIVYNAFKDLDAEAKKDGFTFLANSGYRSYESQENVYNSYVQKMGERETQKIAAKPGYSEHQTGLALDIFTMQNASTKTFKESEAYQWLKNYAYLYGFIERFPEGKENITGYSPEAWHWRYVGIEAAKIIHEENITYDEYYAYYIENAK